MICDDNIVDCVVHISAMQFELLTIPGPTSTIMDSVYLQYDKRSKDTGVLLPHQ